MIPCDLAEELIDNIFAYRFLQMYASVGFSEYLGEYVPHLYGDWYSEAKRQSLEDNTKAMALEIQEARYKEDLSKLKKPKGMKIGSLIFALFSFFNIILPLFLSITKLSDMWCVVVMRFSIGTVSLGLVAVFSFLVYLLKWKE